MPAIVIVHALDPVDPGRSVLPAPRGRIETTVQEVSLDRFSAEALGEEVDVLVVDLPAGGTSALPRVAAAVAHSEVRVVVVLAPEEAEEAVYAELSCLLFRQLQVLPRRPGLAALLPLVLERALTQAIRERICSYMPRRDEARLREIAARCESLEDEALTDPLTRVGNRRALQRDLASLARKERTVGFLLVDLDELKTINDRHSHATGDAALLRVAEVLSSRVRRRDGVYRVGGDEFALLCPDPGPDATAALARRLKQSLGREPLEVSASESPTGPCTLPITVSIGQIIIALTRDTDLSDLLRQAHGALAREKRTKRPLEAV